MIYSHLILIVIAYLVGCLNTGYYLVKFTAGGDLRDMHSGNAGATNAGRVLGKKGFHISFWGDFLKGIAMVAAATMLHMVPPAKTFVLFAVVVGHIFPVQLGFKGGKGISTICGGMLIYDPVVTAICVALFFICRYLIKNKLYSILIALFVFAIGVFVRNGNVYEFIVILSLSFLITFKHANDILEHTKSKAHGR